MHGRGEELDLNHAVIATISGEIAISGLDMLDGINIEVVAVVRQAGWVAQAGKDLMDKVPFRRLRN